MTHHPPLTVYPGQAGGRQ